MKKKNTTPVWSNLHAIYTAAAASNDGQRCMIAPSPEVKLQLKKELKRLKDLSANQTLSNLLSPRQKKRVGLNDGLIMPGKVFPLGTSAEAVRKNAVQRQLLRGALRVVVVLVEFSDKKLSYDKQHYEDLFFSTGVVPTGSVNEYYQEVSGGIISIEGAVEGPYTLPQPLRAYANNASGLSDNEPNARTMAQDAAKAANNSVDFSLYDNDHDGYVDAFVVIHAGSGAEETTSKGDIWSHKWVLPDEYNADDTKIYGYLTVPEDCKLGVCAHELGHLLFGFPDLYDSDYDSSGIGNWCLMAAGSWNNRGDTPAHPCAWCKMQQDWVTVENQTVNQTGVYIAPVAEDRKIYRLWKDGGPGNEYFLLENRQQEKYDQYLPASGLLIWHIDDDIADNDNYRHYKVALMQADGKNDLESGNNEGDAGDCWPGSSGNSDFSSTTTPSSVSYGNLDTYVQVTHIQQENGHITADLSVTSDNEIAPDC
ncbi:immune inhibitor A [Filimonas lacunae]|uniref:Immune inhibitor A n=1 Tax=Filimonas lacunae TaxID=477680 RepID=A0A173MK33_9BACT|nr:M6 family metalloprotease domain-containing protein [Filimonas lacunae]BAV07758.1 protease [Filimonas lacunae]SIT04436.1 immune inhibitor A [Filimonas lacunae]